MHLSASKSHAKKYHRYEGPNQKRTQSINSSGYESEPVRDCAPLGKTTPGKPSPVNVKSRDGGIIVVLVGD